MKMNIKLLKIIGIFTLIIAFFLTSCSQKGSQKEPEAKQQAAEDNQESGKAPEELQSIESGIESIFKILEGPAVEMEEDTSKKTTEEDQTGKKQEQGQDQGQEQQSSDEEGSQKQQGESGQDGQQKQGGQQQQQPRPKDPWAEITPIVNKLHYQWNAYMPKAVKMGANKTLIENFSNALNSLTNTIITKNKTNTLLAASYLYAYVPDMYSLYRTSTSPEVKRIRHYIRNAMLNGMTANWTQADTDMGSLKSSWSLFKNTIPKEQQDNANKLDFSIYELEKVIKEKNQPLTDIKGRVALANVQAIEKASEKEGGQEGGGEQEGGSQGGEEQSGGEESEGG